MSTTKSSKQYPFSRLHFLWSAGCCFNVRYNTATRRMWGSHMCFTIWLSKTLISVLSLLSMAFGLIYMMTKEHFKDFLILYSIFIALNLFTTPLSLRSLFKCSMTEPGIIPTAAHLGEGSSLTYSAFKHRTL